MSLTMKVWRVTIVVMLLSGLGTRLLKAENSVASGGVTPFYYVVRTGDTPVSRRQRTRSCRHCSRRPTTVRSEPAAFSQKCGSEVVLPPRSMAMGAFPVSAAKRRIGFPARLPARATPAPATNSLRLITLAPF